MWFWLSLYYAFFAAFYTFGVKFLTKTFSPIAFMVLLDSFNLIPLIAVIILTGGFPHLLPGFALNIGISTALDIAAALGTFWAIKNTPISLIAPLAAFNPVLTTIFAAFYLHEIPQPLKLLGIFIIVVGTYFLNLQARKEGFFKPFLYLIKQKGVKIYLLSNVLWALTPSFQKQAILATSPHTPLMIPFVECLLTVLLFTPFALPQISFAKVRSSFFLFLLFAILVTTGQAAAFLAYTLNLVGYTIAFFKLSVIFTIIIGAIFLKEDRIKERFVAGIIMLAGILLLAL